MRTSESHSHSTDLDSDAGDSSDPLCCCEYFNHRKERAHILTCCCNCTEFDNCCERLVCCKKVSCQQVSQVMNMISDKIRIPWRGGAKKIDIDAFLPIILVPLLLFLAAQSVVWSFCIFLCLPLALVYTHHFLLKLAPNTKFFLIWSITSLVVIYIIFERNVVPILMIEVEENILFIIFLTAACCCFVRTKTLAMSYHVKNYSVVSTSSSESVISIDEGGNESINPRFNYTETICPVCRKRVPPRTYHCTLCHACVYKRDLHCIWLDCCIGEMNHRMYMSGLVLLLIGLLLCAYFIFVTICNPTDFFLTIKLPGDCSDVYVDIMFSVCFVVALYCLLISVFLTCLLAHEVYMISLGMTGHEWRISSHRYWCLRSKSIYSKGCWNNWKSYFKS